MAIYLEVDIHNDHDDHEENRDLRGLELGLGLRDRVEG
jgi:hypothetical protein